METRVLCLCLALVAVAAPTCVRAASYRSAASCTSPCVWTSTSSWVPTGSPTNGDNVVLSSGTTISLTSNTFAVNITFESASTLRLSSSGILASGSTIWGRGTIFIDNGGVWQAPTSQAGAAGIDLVINSIDTNFRLDYTAGSVSALTINSLQVNTNTLFEVAQISGGSNLTVNGNVTFLALPIAMIAKPSSGGSAPFVMNVFGATQANQQSNSQTILTTTANIIYNSYGWFGPNVQGENTDVIITSAFRLISGPFAWRCSSGCTFRGPAYVGSGVTFPQLLGPVTVESSSLNSFSGSVFAATAFTQTGGAFGGFVSGATGSSVITFSGVTASADVTVGTGTLTGSLTNTGRKLTLSGTNIASGTTIAGGSVAGSLHILTPLAINTFISN